LFPPVVAAPLAIFACFLAAPASAACKSQAPEDILQCLQWAYADKDSAAYAELLTDDFRLYNFGPDSTFWDRDVAAKAASSLFRRVKSLRLDILDGWKLKPADTPDSWLLDSLSAKVTIETTGATGRPIEQSSVGNTLYVKRVAGAEPRIVMYKWVHALAPASPPAAETTLPRSTTNGVPHAFRNREPAPEPPAGDERERPVEPTPGPPEGKK
jgi:hypothetical protein